VQGPYITLAKSCRYGKTSYRLMLEDSRALRCQESGHRRFAADLVIILNATPNQFVGHL